ALVAIALGDDRPALAGGKRLHFEVRGRSLDIGNQAEDVPDRERMQALAQRAARGGGRTQRAKEPIERSVLAEEEELVLAAEVVIQVGGGEIGGDGDVTHAGAGEAAPAKDLRGGAEDLDPARF